MFNNKEILARGNIVLDEKDYQEIAYVGSYFSIDDLINFKAKVIISSVEEANKIKKFDLEKLEQMLAAE